MRKVSNGEPVEFVALRYGLLIVSAVGLIPRNLGEVSRGGEV